MSETVTLTLDKEMAKTVQTIQALRDCGIIRMTDELTCMDGIWEKLSPEDKRFVAGMIKGSAVMLSEKPETAV